MDVCQDSVMPPFFFFFDGASNEMRVRWGDTNVLLSHGEIVRKLPQSLCSVDTVVLAESVKELDKMF